MLRISLVSIGDRMPSWVQQGFQEYQKRIRGRLSLELVELSSVKRGKSADVSRIIRAEEEKIMAAIPDNHRIVALDRKGKSWSTLELSGKLETWMDEGRRVALVIGGPEGLSNEFLTRAEETWSLSALTFAHPLVRVLVAEQIYRSQSILDGAPYHR